jgi:hypothetical protein
MIMMSDRVRIKKTMPNHALYPSVSRLHVCFDVSVEAIPAITTSTFGPTGGRLGDTARDNVREY